VKNFNSTEPSPKDLKLFSIVLSILTIIGLALIGFSLGPTLLIAFTVLFISWIFSKHLKFFYLLWLKLGVLLSYLAMPIVFGLVYFILFTPLAIWFKVIRRDILKRKLLFKNSYWENYDSHPQTVERYRRLF
jgi:4-hydroxybenzoate polyprenyltransferase